MADQNDYLKISVYEFCKPATWTATVDTPISDIVKMLKEHKIHHIPVVESKRAVGIISDRDISANLIAAGATSVTAKEVMTPTPYTVVSSTSLEEAASMMVKLRINSVLVENPKGELIGIFTSTDAISALIDMVKGKSPIIIS